MVLTWYYRIVIFCLLSIMIMIALLTPSTNFNTKLGLYFSVSLYWWLLTFDLVSGINMKRWRMPRKWNPNCASNYLLTMEGQQTFESTSVVGNLSNPGFIILKERECIVRSLTLRTAKTSLRYGTSNLAQLSIKIC